MGSVLAGIGILIVIIGIVFVIYRNQVLHQEACTDEHLAEILQTIQKLQEEILEKLQKNDATDVSSLRNLEQKDRIVIGYTSKHLILTYLVAAHPDDTIVHHISMSWSQKKIPIKTAAYLSSVVVHGFKKQDDWDKELRVANKKTQVFHFFLRVQNEDGIEFLRKEPTSFSVLQENLEAIRNMSLEVQVQRKQDQSELES